MGHFEVFGLEPRLSLDLPQLEKLFHSRSRELHPDRFARAPKDEQQKALDESSRLNDAYRTLRDPIRRAEYVLKEHGFDIGEQGTKDVPPELLEEVFDLNMALEELKGGDAAMRPQVEAMRERFQTMLNAADSRLGEQFSHWDRSQEREVLQEIRTALNRRRYIENLVHTCRKTLDGN